MMLQSIRSVCPEASAAVGDFQEMIVYVALLSWRSGTRAVRFLGTQVGFRLIRAKSGRRHPNLAKHTSKLTALGLMVEFVPGVPDFGPGYAFD